MAGEKWEVFLVADSPCYEIWCKKFPSYRRARRFVKKKLRQNQTFYSAVIADDKDSVLEIFYWNGKKIIRWDKPWVLSRRQALALED